MTPSPYVESVLNAVPYEPNIRPQPISRQIYRAKIIPRSTENLTSSTLRLIVVGLRSSWLDDYIGLLLGTSSGDIEHIPSQNLHQHYDILDSNSRKVASYFGSIKIVCLPYDQDKVRVLMGLLYRSLIGMDGHDDAEARSRADDFDHLFQRGYLQVGISPASRFFRDMEAIISHQCTRQMASGFIGPFRVSESTEHIRAVMEREAGKNWEHSTFKDLHDNSIEHFMIIYERIAEQLRGLSQSSVHDGLTFSMDQAQWMDAISSARRMAERRGKECFYLWLDEIAMFRFPGTDWTKMGFILYGTLHGIIVGTSYGGKQADVNKDITTHNQKILCEFGQGWTRRRPNRIDFDHQEGLGLCAPKALTKMAGMFLSGKQYEVSEHWRTRINSFCRLCTQICASEYPVGPLTSLEETDIINPMNVNRAVQAATIYVNDNRFLQGRFGNIFTDRFAISGVSGQRWTGLLEVVPRLVTTGVDLEYDSSSSILVKVVCLDDGRVLVVHFSPQGVAYIVIRVWLTGSAFDERNQVRAAERIPLSCLSQAQLEDIESRFGDGITCAALSTMTWEWK